MKMKRLIAMIAAAALLAVVFAGCGGSKQPDSGKLKIIATIYPEYEWVKNIVGDAGGVEVSLLLDKGVDLHSFEPTAKNIVDISSCDVFIYNGGESDEWVNDVLKEAQNKSITAVDLLDELGESAKEEKIVEGMQTEPKESGSGEEGTEYDEHIWLSLKNAEALTKRLCDKLGEKDPGNKAVYEKNADEYIKKLDALDKQYAQTVKEAKNDTLIFADRFPFRYLTDDYNINYYAAFSGCSAESEASFQTLVFLADKLNELDLNKLIIIDGSDKKIADAVIDTSKRTDVKTLTLNSMQSSIGENDTYIGIMESNLDVLKEALN